MSAQPTSPTLPPFTDLSEKLMSDSEGLYHRALLNQLNHTLAAKKEAIAKGVAPDEKDITDGEIKAIEGAARIIDLFWHSVHVKNQPTNS